MISTACSFYKVKVVEECVLFVLGKCLSEAVSRHACRGDVLNRDCSSLDLLPQPVVVDINVSELCLKL